MVGGPDGIPEAVTPQIQDILTPFMDVPLVVGRLPGGMLHSSSALASLFALHEQGLLMPFLSFYHGPLRSHWPVRAQEVRCPWCGKRLLEGENELSGMEGLVSQHEEASGPAHCAEGAALLALRRQLTARRAKLRLEQGGP